MDISTRRVHVKSIGGGLAHVRDRNAPYHLHTVKTADLPDAHSAAMMTESQYDDAVLAAVYA